MQDAILPDVGFVRLPQVLRVIPVSRATWYARVAEGRYPAPCKLGRTSVWRVEDIRSLIAELGQQPSTPEPRSAA